MAQRGLNNAAKGMMKTVTVYGERFSLIRVEGGISAGIVVDSDKVNKMTFSDGTTLIATYDVFWRIDREKEGTATMEKTKKGGRNTYSDHVTLTGDLEWVATGTIPGEIRLNLQVFPINSRDGWVIPQNTRIADLTHIPDFSEIGAGCLIGDDAVIGKHSRIEEGCAFGDDVVIGNNCGIAGGCTFGEGTVIENNCRLGGECVIGHDSRIDSGCNIGDSAVIGHRSKLGNSITLGNYCRIGDDAVIGNDCLMGRCCVIPAGCTMEGQVMESFMTLANVDGTGRQVTLIKTAGGVIVRAGCFVGSLEQFCTKAAKEGKHRYVRVITACAAAL